MSLIIRLRCFGDGTYGVLSRCDALQAANVLESLEAEVRILRASRETLLGLVERSQDRADRLLAAAEAKAIKP